MIFYYTNLETYHEATGIVAVIDVVRAFTNAAVACSRGAKEIYPVSGVEEALLLKAQIPNSLVCGEVGWKDYCSKGGRGDSRSACFPANRPGPLFKP
jgi:2-phosphosulfolactate phosphatase